MAKSRKRSGPGTSADPDAAQPTTGSPAATAEPQPDLRMDEDHRERVARRAYELYLSRGGRDGSDWEDWLAAERELTEGQQTAQGSARSGRDE